MRTSSVARFTSREIRQMAPVPLPAVSLTVKRVPNVEIPMLGFGTYRMAPLDVDAAVRCAVEHGFRHFDCAKIYGNQKEIGLTLADVVKCPPKGVAPISRKDLWITSKLWPTDQHPDNVEKACRQTLQELKLDYLDLYLVHWPVCWEHTGKFDTDDDKVPKDAQGLARVDETVRLTDTWKAMCQLVKKGLVRNIGLSNCNEKHMLELTELVGKDPDFVAPLTNQIECHLALKQSELRKKLALEYGVATSAYCPLGMPTRFTPQDFKGVANEKVLIKMGEIVGLSPARLMLTWNVDEGNITIVKATSRKHIIDNSKVALHGLGRHVRLMLCSLQLREIRVINPTDFTRSGKPFFD